MYICKHYNNHSGAYIAGTQNSYIIIMASLQVLVNNLLVWQSSCECAHTNCLCIPFDREESNESKDKIITMVQ